MKPSGKREGGTLGTRAASAESRNIKKWGTKQKITSAPGWRPARKDPNPNSFS